MKHPQGICHNPEAETRVTSHEQFTTPSLRAANLKSGILFCCICRHGLGDRMRLELSSAGSRQKGRLRIVRLIIPQADL